MIFFALVGAAAVVAVLVAATLSLFLRRHGESDRPGPGWVPTDEVFRDPGTERVMRVWADAVGGRHYLPERPGAMPQP
ncbi:MAG TPA: hypothetical protein VN816_03445 [Acidimicrobiales bacterium]|nr:hypothetical protein [Acidimicrobiales bacterium]